MRVGIIAEGRGDLAVLVNILKGKLDLDVEDIEFLRPEFALDKTDTYHHDEAARGGWGRVKRECLEREKIADFQSSPVDDDVLVVIHLDTAEAHDKGYDVQKPRRDDPAYAEVLRRRVVEKINAWLEGEGEGRVRHAVAVEETEAWVLTIFSTKDSATHGDPKEKLGKLLNKTMSDKDRRRHFQLGEYDQAHALTRPFRKLRELEKLAERNRSLRLFVDSLCQHG